MTETTSVEFPGTARLHLALAVGDLERSRAFYQALLQVEPTKVRPGYVRFEVAQPPLHLALNESSAATAHQDPQHFGIQVKTREFIAQSATRMEAAGYLTRPEEQVSCCYAVQDKVWIDDPDGHRWEIYRTTHDDAEHRDETPATQAQSCCPPTCCT